MKGEVMKARRLLISVFALILLGSVAVASHSRAGDKSVVTGTEVFDPLGLFGPPVGQILSPGSVECPGNEPTGNPLQPCPAGSRIHIRDFTYISRVNASDPTLSGWMTVVSNANWDANATGPNWGTASLALDAGGTWDGTWQGVRVQDGSTWVIPIHFSGQGTGGAVDGMHLLVVDRAVGFTAMPIAYVGTIESRIVDPHGK
jgi:hypothetical protein